MFLIHDSDDGRRQIWAAREPHGWDFYVYGLTASGDPRIASTLGAACDLLGVDARPILDAAPCLG